jgi:hypothetical protein
MEKGEMGPDKETRRKMRKGTNQPLVVSREEAARMLGDVHVQTVIRWAREKKLERIFLGRRSMITLSSIHALVRRARLNAAQAKSAIPEELVRAGSRTGRKREGSKSLAATPA